MDGLSLKRMGIALLVAAFFGAGCAYGTSTVEIPGFTVTMPYLLTIFYSRLMIGLVIGLAGEVKLMKKEPQNSLLRGGLAGAIVSIGISFYGGAEILTAAGIVYGIITDFLATRFGS
jgi:hypothetical protein